MNGINDFAHSCGGYWKQVIVRPDYFCSDLKKKGFDAFKDPYYVEFTPAMSL